MTSKPALPSRRSLRLPLHDYRCPGTYYVTVCTWHRRPLFGKLARDGVHLSALGDIATELWTQIPQHVHTLHLDEFVIMPDHLHGLVVLDRWPAAVAPPHEPLAAMCGSRGDERSPTARRPRGPTRGSLGAIIGSYKSAVTREINRLRGTPGQRVWHRNYYEAIIRDAAALRRVRRYIRANPRRALITLSYR